jgi:hypothetical protein
MSYSAEELIRLSFPQNADKIITLHKEEKRLVSKSFELTKEENCMFQSMLFHLTREHLVECAKQYKAIQTERAKVGKRLLEVRLAIKTFASQ